MSTIRPLDGALERIWTLGLELTAERSAHDQARAELAHVHAALAPLWPAANDGSAAELAELAADVIERHRASCDAHPARAEASPGWRRRLATALGLIALAAVGGLVAFVLSLWVMW